MENCESYDEEEEESNETDNSTDNESLANSTTRRRRLAKTVIEPELPYARGNYGNALC